MGQGLKLLDIGVFSLGTPFLKGIVSLFGGGVSSLKMRVGYFVCLPLTAHTSGSTHRCACRVGTKFLTRRHGAQTVTPSGEGLGTIIFTDERFKLHVYK